jgi:hypothetical protein
MKPFRATCIALSALVISAISACDRSRTPARLDSLHVGAPNAADSSNRASGGRSWDPSAGPLLLVASSSPSSAYLILPDSGNQSAVLAGLPQPASVTLLGRGGTVQSAELPSLSDTSACLMGTLSAARPPRPWSVGFIGGVVLPLGMDSTESIGTGDSAVIVTSVNRIASALPNDSAGRFSGLAFVVRSLWRFNIPGASQVVVAALVRQINQEATPLQEHTMVIGERQPGDSSLIAAYSERSYGNEETIESREVLAAALLGPTRGAALILSRDYGDATAYGLLERSPNGKWRARWTSPRRRC